MQEPDIWELPPYVYIQSCRLYPSSPPVSAIYSRRALPPLHETDTLCDSLPGCHMPHKPFHHVFLGKLPRHDFPDAPFSKAWSWLLVRPSCPCAPIMGQDAGIASKRPAAVFIVSRAVPPVWYHWSAALSCRASEG